MEKSSTIQQKVAATTASVLTNANQKAEETHQILDQEAANTLSRGNGGNQHRELVISIKEMAVESGLELPPSSNECCIYRIPTHLRKLNEEAYTPQVISIGPFHHDSKRLEPMKKLKLKYFQRFLRRIENFNVLDILVNDIKVQEKRVRECYAETINLSSDNFVKLILVDGSFLIEFFYNILSSQGSDGVVRENRTLLNPISWPAFKLDLQLLENQLPFFVLEILFSHARLANYRLHSFSSLAIYFFEVTHGQKLPQNLAANARHIVDLVRALRVPSPRKLLSTHESNDLASANHLYSASQLDEAGVKFKTTLCY
ncbi:UPF0481 protein At3g47200-like [Juglans regia]|uniref:UPF0481 protein At3g47200-like n=1 Tax=Juglans regia TaxID=51240 RepID=A0A6P9EYB1_JUGRE|nr:UPF0481 protein At3g47200-like [Juglans regia]